MVITPHALIGMLAARASRAGHPAVATAIGAASHFAADRIPHTDYHPFTKYGRWILLADIALATTLVTRTAQRRSEVVGALAGAGVDAWVTIERKAGYRYVDRFHAWNHTSQPLPPVYAILGQLALAGGTLMALELTDASRQFDEHPRDMQVVGRLNRQTLLVYNGDGYSGRMLDLKAKTLGAPMPLEQLYLHNQWRRYQPNKPLSVLLEGVHQEELQEQWVPYFNTQRDATLAAYGPWTDFRGGAFAHQRHIRRRDIKKAAITKQHRAADAQKYRAGW